MHLRRNPGMHDGADNGIYIHFFSPLDCIGQTIDAQYQCWSDYDKSKFSVAKGDTTFSGELYLYWEKFGRGRSQRSVPIGCFM